MSLAAFAAASLSAAVITTVAPHADAQQAAAANVTVVAPCVGPHAGGTAVSVSGSGFYGPDNAPGGGDDVASVLFAEGFSTFTAGTGLQLSGAGLLTIVSPPGTDGTTVSIAVVFPDNSYAFKQSSFLYSSDASASGPCGVTPTDLPSFQTFRYLENCPTIGGTFEITGDRLDELNTDDASWGVWARQGGQPGVNTLLEPGPGEIRAAVIAQSRTRLVFQLPGIEQMPGWTPGDIVDLIFRNGRGQVGYGGINWHRPNRCWEFDADPSNVDDGHWPMCETETDIGCATLTDTSGNAIPALSVWVQGYGTNDASNWGIGFHVVPTTSIPLLTDGTNPWVAWVGPEARPLDGLNGAGTFDLTGLLPANNTVRVTLRTGDLKAPKRASLRAYIDPTKGVEYTSNNGSGTIIMDLTAAAVTFPTQAELPNCTLGVEPGVSIPFTRPTCTSQQGGSTRLTISGGLDRWSFWHPSQGQWTATSATLVGGYELAKGLDGAPQLRIAIGAPHLTAAGQENVGFVQVFVTDWQLANLGLSPANATELAGQLQIARDDQAGSLTATFHRLTGGYLVSISGQHFSAPLITARTRPATMSTFVDAAPCDAAQIIVKGSGFTMGDGTSRVDLVTFRSSTFEQVASPNIRVINDTSIAVEIPTLRKQGIVTLHAFGQFGETGDVEFLAVAPPIAAAGDRQVTLDWSAAEWGTGSPITDYVIQQSTNCGAWTTIRDGRSTATSFTVTRLTNGSTYRFRIAPIRNSITGPWSAAASSVPRTTPSAPSSLSVTSGPRILTLGWSAPFNGGSAITDYVVQYSTDRRTWLTFADGTSTSTTATITGLTPRVKYYVRVAANNVAGTGAFSSVGSGTPSGP